MKSKVGERRWEILAKDKARDEQQIIKTLLANRGITTKTGRKEFFNPAAPAKIKLKELGISPKSVEKAILRLKKAKKNKEKIFIYGDYDADGICATAIVWECLYSLGFDVLPYIPERFSEGYGINVESVGKLKEADDKFKLVITVDNGIVASKEIEAVNKLGVDVIISDHHQKEATLPKAHAIIYTDRICGAAVAWIFAREILKKFKISSLKFNIQEAIGLSGIGTIADQMPLTGFNRSFAKSGLGELRRTKRPGLLEIYRGSRIDPNTIGTYEVNYIIAPRINAMGRIEHGIDSLRMLCTTSRQKAVELANKLGKVNQLRQKIVEEVLVTARKSFAVEKKQKIIIISNASYHEGVIGLAAGKLVEEFYLPAIVISRGEKISKASARSISGFNIIEAIRHFDDILEAGGGHPMAAGFSILTERIEDFTQKMLLYSAEMVSDDMLSKKLKIDMELDFDQLTPKLHETLKEGEPFGIGNPQPVFMTRNVEVIDSRIVGKEKDHLKLKLKDKGASFWAVGFGMAEAFSDLGPEKKIDVAYNLEENAWNGSVSLELKLKDLRLGR